MNQATVLRFPITGRETDFFILEVSPHGSKPLDVKLLGTEGEAVFVTKLRHRRITEHKSSTGYCTDVEWEAILAATFIEQKPVHDIEVRADVPKDSSSISLSFRKNIQGITQRLGSIKIPERPEDDTDDRNEIQPFDWCVSLLGRQAELRETAATSAAQITILEHTVEQLKDQLRELIEVKENDETRLLEKFRDLLNEKKVKIRQQQRLLAAANIDDQTLAKLEQDERGGRRKPNTSRSAKRKGGTGDVESNDEEDVGGEADAMDVDQSGSPQLDAEPDERMTTDEETQDEASAQSSDEQEPKKPPRIAKSQANQRAQAVVAPQRAATTRSRRSKKSPEVKAEPSSQHSDDAPPAKRELPFMRNKKKVAPPPDPKPAVDGDGDETGSDEEL